MSERRHIQMLVFLILMLQFTVTEQLSSFVAVRAGDDVTLTCERVKDEQDECQNIEWIYNDADHTRTDGLVSNGQIVASRSNRLRLGEKCSLVIKNVTDQDVGRYFCRGGGDSDIYLSVVTLTKYKIEHRTTFYCYVSSHKDCEPSVKWLNQDKVIIGNRDLKASQTRYYAVVSFEDSQRIHSSVMNSLTCEVTDCKSNVHQFLLRPQTSDKDVKPATTESSTSVTTVRISSTTDKGVKPAPTNSSTSVPTVISSPTASSSEASPTELSWWWWLIVGTVTSAALVVALVIAVKRRQRGHDERSKVKQRSSVNAAFSEGKPQMNEKDPEDGLSYASLSFTRTSSREAQVHVSDGGDAVTYSCVNYTGASTGPSSLYATVSRAHR